METNNSKLTLFHPIVQYLFAGLSSVLLAIVFWQINSADRYMRDILQVQRETNQVIERNTAAIGELGRVVQSKL